MVVHTYGKRERLPRILLSMRVGHLFDATREERRELLREVCEEKDLEAHLEDSYRRVATFDDIPTPTISAMQQGLQWPGKQMGEELVNEGFFFRDSPGQVYPLELQSAVNSKIHSYVTKRIGSLDNGNPWAPWHGLNVLLFLLAVVVSAAEEPGDDWSTFPWLAWILSVNLMWVIRLSKRKQEEKAERVNQYNRKYEVLARPLLAAIDQELKKAAKHKELEDLVTNQSWPGRGIPSSNSESALGVDPSYARLRQSQGLSAVPSWRSSTKPAKFQRNFQAGDAKRAEELCAGWLRRHGDHTAATTKDGADGGVDIRSNKYVAQVKNYKGSVGVQPVREIFGIAAAEKKTALFFTSGTYTKAAKDFADSVEMPLIIYDAVLQKFSGANLRGRMFA